MQAAIHCLVEATVRAAAVVAEDRATPLIGSGIKRVGALRIDGDVGDAGVVVDGKRLCPGDASVSGFIHAAIFVGAPQVPQRGYIHDVGIGGMNHDASDVVRIFETHVGPGLARVERLVDTRAPGRTLAIVRLARAGV